MQIQDNVIKLQKSKDIHKCEYKPKTNLSLIIKVVLCTVRIHTSDSFLVYYCSSNKPETPKTIYMMNIQTLFQNGF